MCKFVQSRDDIRTTSFLAGLCKFGGGILRFLFNLRVQWILRFLFNELIEFASSDSLTYIMKQVITNSTVIGSSHCSFTYILDCYLHWRINRPNIFCCRHFYFARILTSKRTLQICTMIFKYEYYI